MKIRLHVFVGLYLISQPVFDETEWTHVEMDENFSQECGCIYFPPRSEQVTCPEPLSLFIFLFAVSVIGHRSVLDL